MAIATVASRPVARSRTTPLSRFVASLAIDPSGSTTYFLLLGLRLSDSNRITALTQQGLPFRMVDTFQGILGLSVDRMAEILQIPMRTLTRRRQMDRLHADESGRLFLVAWVFARALALHDGNLERAHRWMDSPARGLGGAAPFTLAADPHGARLIDSLIGQIEHGLGA